jgi:hypothetical protein
MFIVSSRVRQVFVTDFLLTGLFPVKQSETDYSPNNNEFDRQLFNKLSVMALHHAWLLFDIISSCISELYIASARKMRTKRQIDGAQTFYRIRYEWWWRIQWNGMPNAITRALFYNLFLAWIHVIYTCSQTKQIKAKTDTNDNTITMLL